MDTADVPGLPDGLPVPADDGAARHLPGRAMPRISLARTDGGEVDLAGLGSGRTVLYLYPMTAQPGKDLPSGWDSIPGARGCTPEACGFRDHHADLRAAGAARVFGMSSQPAGDQQEAASRLRLPFPLLSDESLAVAEALSLPTFTAGGQRLYRRLTMIISGDVIEHVFYPVFPPDRHAEEVLGWLRARAGR